ncbi:hypothetical protein [Paenibacillus rhizophilus]|nr:hypothetical protein [Paenibacillus rhizophilus]
MPKIQYTNGNCIQVTIYVCMSSERQAEKELSIPAQIKAIQQYC